MTAANDPPLARAKCVPCEGGVAALTAEQGLALLAQTPEWAISDDGKWIDRTLRLKNFTQAVDLINQIASVAEAEQHHPDLHLTGYRNLKVAISTHAIGGLSQNDFILAAKIDEIIDAA